MTAPDHPVMVRDRDLFAMSAACLTCGRLAYWRLGVGRWGHIEDAAE